MNKIVLDSNIKYTFDRRINYEYIDGFIKKIKLRILKDTEVRIECKYKEDIKYDIQIDIDDNVQLKLIEIKKHIDSKIQFKYTLGNNSKIEIIKVNDVKNINEKDIINLNGEYATADLILKTAGIYVEKYDILVNHNKNNTVSNITTNGLNVDGNIYFTVSAYVPQGKKNCICNQQNRIINLAQKECVIKPNLLIEDVDTTANHSALIGNFTDEELFYIQRLGIDKNTAVKLLIEGFIKNGIDDKLVKNLKRYWR